MYRSALALRKLNAYLSYGLWESPMTLTQKLNKIMEVHLYLTAESLELMFRIILLLMALRRK